MEATHIEKGQVWGYPDHPRAKQYVVTDVNLSDVEGAEPGLAGVGLRWRTPSGRWCRNGIWLLCYTSQEFVKFMGGRTLLPQKGSSTSNR